MAPVYVPPRVLLVGASGSGKSFTARVLARELLAERAAAGVPSRVLVVDPAWDWNLSGAQFVRSRAELLTAASRWTGPIVVRTRFEDFSPIAGGFAADPRPWPDVFWIFDELRDYMSAGHIHDSQAILWSRGRHERCALLAMTQSPTRLHNMVLENVNRVYVFTLQKRYDLDKLEEGLSLPRGTFDPKLLKPVTLPDGSTHPEAVEPIVWVRGRGIVERAKVMP